MLKVFGEHLVDSDSINQLRSALELPIAVKAALMPDSHVGYGIPIGGVLATVGGVIPYAVGVDIACRVKLTIFHEDERFFERYQNRLEQILKEKCFFGVGVTNPLKEYHPVLDHPLWKTSKFLASLKDLARKQLGTSGSGNHFVEFGFIKFLEPFEKFSSEKKYLALVSHSGSRGLGSKICQYFSELARKQSKMPKHLEKLSWLPLPGEGEQYWEAMELAGVYASANHCLIHERVSKAAGLDPIFTMENHHNFAWREDLDGTQVIVHRKGATPAKDGQLGYIPGTMSDPGFLVMGKGNKDSINSSAHGAGRIMSRRQAKRELSFRQSVSELTERRGVRVIQAGVDESPLVYKNIRAVLEAQTDCVKLIAEFQPKLVIMAGEDEPPED
ncbi:MAG: RtcB family protein [Deltaproteobacteria bacterium]|nr:RtcB family protein [Deltaproteobacteria bacterium]MCX7953426.1 RtcB family protein [Deltaproteobacteria bacterium]